jgi:hypothetical protein
MQLSHQREEFPWTVGTTALETSLLCLLSYSYAKQPKLFVGSESYDVVIAPN